MTFDLTDPTLFGNDAAEDESVDVFRSYFLARTDYKPFSQAGQRLLVVRAYKGEGKSALLRYAEEQVSKTAPESLRIFTTPATMSVHPASDTPDEWVRAWKVAILGHLAGEVGARIGTAWNDDAMSLVEEAEKGGFKSRNVVGAVVDRIKISTEGASVDLKKLGVVDAQRLFKRFPLNYPVWLFIDDLDLNFENNAQAKAKIAGMFTACRQLVSLIPQLYIRTSIRPNVWVIVKREAEAMSHVEQYMIDLQWQAVDLRNLLARRIEGYLKRTEQRVPAFSYEINRQAREEELIGLLFDNPMPWGRDAKGTKQRPPHIILSTLSRQRPRWLIELCKEAAKRTVRRDSPKISINDITNCLEAFGERRVSDTVVEFRAMCPDIEEILTAFVGQSEEYKTDELLQLIKTRVLNNVRVRLAGAIGVATALQIAQFLFQIGFLTAKKQLATEYEHYSYADKPELLKSRTNLDQGLSWEIHPVFRQVLQIRDEMGAPKARRKSRG